MEELLVSEIEGAGGGVERRTSEICRVKACKERSASSSSSETRLSAGAMPRTHETQSQATEYSSYQHKQDG